MADQHRHDDLAQLRAELAAQRLELTTQRGEIARLTRRRRLSRRTLPLLLATCLVALVPLVTLAANPFTDLNPGSPHNGNIDLIFNAGITTGCDPGVAYCPNATVTREEMASFLARTAGLGDNPPVANALTARTATSAANADQLGGQPSGFYQPAGQPIANATNAVTAQSAAQADNAATVGGLAPNALARVARGTSLVNGTLTGVPQVVVSATLTTPGPGFVLVVASANFQNTVTTAGSTAQVLYYLTGPDGQISGNQFTTAGQNNVGDQSGATTHVFAVAAAGPQTFSLVARNYFGTSQAFLPRLTALYVPFGSTGAGTLGADQPQPADGGDKPKP